MIDDSKTDSTVSWAELSVVFGNMSEKLAESLESGGGSSSIGFTTKSAAYLLAINGEVIGKREGGVPDWVKGVGSWTSSPQRRLAKPSSNSQRKK